MNRQTGGPAWRPTCPRSDWSSTPMPADSTGADPAPHQRREASRDGVSAIHLAIKPVAAAAIPALNRFPSDWQPRDPTYACLEVTDSGCGITAGDMEKIFDPFFTSKFIGRGLVLAVVLGIVRQHGGSIIVESAPGRGSVFRVFLPVTAAAAPQTPVPVVPAPRSAVRGTVLVVEDEPSLRATVTQVLQLAGFKVFAAADGVAGVALFEQHRDEIQCVVCDLSMPRLDGWETLTALRPLALHSLQRLRQCPGDGRPASRTAPRPSCKSLMP